ncbi:MAG TPA: LLM class flavin-dependent oxidoreductase, partial [Acidimicrobiales bacterium]|nr:LLM class flavin-dependent oxidoreductase [Acidimicrobiales bacterium]
MPAVSLVAMPGRRLRTLELAKEMEDRGFQGIYGPSFGDVISLCLSIGHVTERIPFGSSIQPIYLRPAADLAATASYLAEVTGGRFHLGLGVSHGPVHKRLGIRPGKPLSDTREYVATIRKVIGDAACPPIVLATLRDKMLQLAVEIGDGAVWANASRSHMPTQLKLVDRDDFYIGNMIPTVIDDDRDAARAVNRKTLTGYVSLPNYRNYWKAAGYVEEMEAVEKAIEAGDQDAVKAAMTDRWLDDCTLSGSASFVRDEIEAWFDAGVKTPIVVPSSTSGGQLKAIEELFAAYS